MDAIYERLERDATIETRLDVDFDGDGEVDTLFVAEGGRGRRAVAMQAYRSADGGSHRAIGVLQLPPAPLVPAQLSFDNGVLSIVDLTGNDTTTQTRYAFGFDRGARTLTLVGLDVARFSRKRLHGSVRLNWDPVYGNHALSYGRLGGGAGSEDGYRYDDVRRSQRKAPRLTMERTPTGDEALARAGVRLGQGAPPAD